MSRHQGQHIRAQGVRKALPVPLEKFFTNESVLVFCMLYSLCVHVWNGSKESMFVCSIVEEKYLLSECSQHAPPFWGALERHVGSFALSLLRSLSLCLLSVCLPTPYTHPCSLLLIAFRESVRRASDFSHSSRFVSGYLEAASSKGAKRSHGLHKYTCNSLSLPQAAGQ